jgi:hypothetical protein
MGTGNHVINVPERIAGTGYRRGMSLPEEFLLLAYDEDGTPLTDGTRLDNGLGGAILLELALGGGSTSRKSG